MASPQMATRGKSPSGLLLLPELQAERTKNKKVAKTGTICFIVKHFYRLNRE
jgi:hypothetical protein